MYAKKSANSANGVTTRKKLRKLSPKLRKIPQKTPQNSAKLRKKKLGKTFFKIFCVKKGNFS